MNKITIFLISFMIAIIFSGCEFKSDTNEVPKPLSKDEQVTLKMAVNFEFLALQDYMNYFSTKFPNLEIKVVSWKNVLAPGPAYNEELDAFIRTEQPDIILFDNNTTFGRWASEGYLFELDPLIKADKFDIENMNSKVIDYIKIKGGGKLFGLAPTFSSEALFYNKDLFDTYNIEYPHNQMSWEEVMQLAAHFPTEGDEKSRIYGFARNSDFNGFSMPFYMVKMMGEDSGLSFFDSTYTNMTIDTQGWKNIFELLLNGVKSGFIYDENNLKATNDTIQYPDVMRRNMFAVGRAAMTVDDFSFVNDRLEYAKQLDGISFPNWDVVSSPVQPALPNETKHFIVNELFGISAQSGNLRAAWEFIKFVNSEEAAKLQSKSGYSRNRLQTRTEYSKERDGRDLSPFYMLEPSSTDAAIMPPKLYMPLNRLISEEVNSLLIGEKTLDEALNVLQQKGQEELIKATLASE